MLIGSLFSGAGGLDMAVERVFGGHTVWHCEVDPAASKVLAHRWPGVPNHHDITAVDWSTVEPIDILCGGFPCQPWSFAGKRAGFNDDRALWPEIIEAVRWLRPSYVVLENVPGLANVEAWDGTDDRCLCGWSYRRRGMCRDSQVEFGAESDLFGEGGCGDDGQGATSTGAATAGVWRDDTSDEAGDREVGCGALLGVAGNGGSPVPGGHRAISQAEGRTGTACIEGSGDNARVGAAEGRPSTVDSSRQESLREAETADTRAELEGAIDPVTGESTTVCPFCGRSVGGRSNGHVFRSGLGEVLRSLAEVGFHARWLRLRASEVGAPHRRERVFILATDTDVVRWQSCWDGPTVTDEPSSRPARDGGDAADSSCDGWHEGWPESAGFVGGSDASVGSDGPVELLPTPCAQQSGNTPENHLAKKPGRKVVTDLAILVENGLLETGGELLPTPRSLDATGVRGRTPNRSDEDNARAGLTLTDVTEHLLPTPLARDGRQQLCDYALLLATPSAADGGGGHLNRSGDRKGELLLPGQAREMATAWGKYEPAIRRWENLTRPAPAPTEPNKNGNPRLSASFSEWLMGWPAGWVTQVPGISRNDQLRIIGNGVVHQQAQAAIRWLLNVSEVAA